MQISRPELKPSSFDFQNVMGFQLQKDYVLEKIRQLKIFFAIVKFLDEYPPSPNQRSQCNQLTWNGYRGFVTWYDVGNYSKPRISRLNLSVHSDPTYARFTVYSPAGH